jgi:Tfp pilus assembly protein PilP
MKLTTGIVALAIMAGTAWAQNPNVIQNTKDALQGVEQQQTAASNQALGTTTPGKPSPATTAKPGAAKAVPAQASTTKPATASTPASTKPAAAPTKTPAVRAKAPAAPAAKPAVVAAKAPAPTGATLKPASAQTSSSSPTLKPATAKAVSAPAKATPAAGKATAQAAVKATPAKATPAPVKTSAAPVKPAAPPKAAAVPAKAIPAATQAAAAKSLPAKPAEAKSPAAAEASTTPDAPKPEKQEDKKYSMTGKRDPFISPVVNRQSGSGCSTGKKCLDIEQIALRGVVKSDNGMIAVVTNGLNKAYFLRENDPVFNGYVEKITVDSIVFKETFQDRLGKPFTKDVVKRILTPAA